MIKLATVFSGIGSIEWAFKRLNIPHKIVFACDNGEILLDGDEDELRAKVNSIQTLKGKKEYIDGLLAKKRRKNFVKETYLANYSIDEENFLHDIRFVDGTKYNDIDLFVGGSPCQSFSIMGYQLGFEDTRGTLFYDYARLVSEIKPKVFIYENVQGMINHDHGNTWKVIKSVFDSLGYNLNIKVLDAKDYGIPQTRRRLFVVGFRKDLKTRMFQFPNPVPLKYTLQDFLITNCKDGNFISNNGKIEIIPGGEELPEKYYLSDLVRAHVMSGGTGNYYTKPEIDLKIARPLLCTMHKMHRAGVDNYVTTNGKIRKLTPRECMRLMGYDDSFKIVTSDLQAYRQAGNSIVVDVMMAVLEEIIKTGVFEEE